MLGLRLRGKKIMRILSWIRRWAGGLLTRVLRPRRVRPFCRKPLQIDLLEDRVLLSTITWSGAGGDASWFDAQNWVGGKVPGAADTAVITQTGITINYSGQATILGITSAASLDISGGGLTVTAGNSSITGSLTIGSGTSLTAQGAGASFIAMGTTTSSGSSLYAEAGANLSLPMLTSYAAPNGGGDWYFEASGAGSTLNLPNLTTIGALTDNTLHIEALQGGQVGLPKLDSINNTRPVQITADGNGSEIDLSALTTFNGYAPGYAELNVTDNGTVLAANLTSFTDLSINFDGTGVIADSQWQTFNTVNFTVTGGSYSLPGLTDITAATLFAGSGGSLTLAGVTSYDAPNGGGDWYLEASGAGSTLELPNLTTIGTLADNTLHIEAMQGGQVGLPKLNSISNTRPVQITADGGGSQIDLSALTTFTGYGPGYAQLNVTDSGTVLAANLTSFTDLSIDLDGTGVIADSQWQTFNTVNFTVTGGSYSLPGLTDITAATLFAGSGGSLTLAGVTSYDAPNGGGDWYLEASGAGSTLDLPNLTTIGTLTDNTLHIEAMQGGQVGLPKLDSISNTRPVQITADGGGSQIDLSALTTFTGYGPGYAQLNVTDSGTVLAANLTSFTDLSIDLDGTGVIADSQWQTFNTVNFTVTGGSYSLPGLTDITAATLFAGSGGSLTLAGVTSYDAPNGGGDWYLEASGAGSTLELPNLTTIGTLTDNTLHIEAMQGGQVGLPKLDSISNTRPVQITADGGGSQIDLSALTTFDGYDPGHAELNVTDRGTVLAANLTSFADLSIDLDGTGVIADSQWQTFNTVNFTVTGGSYSLPGLTDITAATLFAGSGGSLTLAGVTSYDAPNGGGDWYLEASGAGSTLDLPNLTTIGTLTGSTLHIEAMQGGQVGLPKLNSISNTRPVQFTADGGGSQIDLSALTTFDGYPGNGALDATDGATVDDGNLTSLDEITVTLDGTGSLATAQWSTFTHGAINATGGTPNLSGLENGGIFTGSKYNNSPTLPAPTTPTTDTWTGDAGDDSFQTAANWSLDSVPSLANQVVIPASFAGSNITSSATVTVLSINSHANLVIAAGAFEVTSGNSAINGTLTVESGASLTATGSGASFTATGTTTINGASLFAESGATLTVPGVASYAGLTGQTTTLEAVGAGSDLALANLTGVTEDAGSYYSLVQIEAVSGGTVALPLLTSISGGPVFLESVGAGSVLNVSDLTSFSGQSGRNSYSTLQATTGGVVDDGKLTTLAYVNLVLNGTGTLSYSQITSYTFGTFDWDSGVITFNALSDIDGSNFVVSGGAVR